MRKKFIYLDYAASTPVDKKVQKAMMPFFRQEFGNPSSSHQLGQRAKAAVEGAREQVAKFLSCSANEIVFTSGATEANNIAVQGVIEKSSVKKPHVIVSSIEHESLLGPVEALEKRGRIEATYIKVGKEGIVNLRDIEKSLKKNTIFVSIQYANSEIGTIQPVAEIAKILKSYEKESGNTKIIFHSDAVQAALYLDCNAKKLGVDLLTLSSHKIYGPKGTGVLYVKKGSAIEPLFFGGGQEQDIRPGSENVTGIIGMGEAIGEIQNPKTKVQNIKIRQLRDMFIKNIAQRISGTHVTGSLLKRLPNNVHIRFKGVEGRDIVLLLDQKGIAVSTGSACSEKSQEPSHVLLGMGHESEEAYSSVRITLGKYTKKEEVEKTVKVLEKVVEQLRSKK